VREAAFLGEPRAGAEATVNHEHAEIPLAGFHFGQIHGPEAVAVAAPAREAPAAVQKRLALPRAFDRVEWFGRGPGESYPDRKSGMPLGRYSGGIDEQFVNYPVPQENGNKCDVRWFRIETSDGLGLLVTGDRPLNVSVHRYETRDIAMARHTADLRPRGYLVLHLDYAMGPLGNASCGNLPPLPEYQLAPAPMKWKMKFQFVTR